MRSPAFATAPLIVVAVATLGAAQDPAPVYQQPPKQSFRFAGDALARYEWTRDLLLGGTLTNEDRYFLEGRPRVELEMGPIELGIGGAFRYSDVENDVPPPGQEQLLIVRDNFRSRDARLDLAWGKLKAGPVVAQGGRFFMPIPLTEMIWDRDLRPQGGALSLVFGPQGSSSRFALHGLYATGSHVFEDESQMYGGALELDLASGSDSRLQLVGSFLEFRDLDALDPVIKRQNTRVGGKFAYDYRVVDLIARLSRGGQLPLQLVADYCWNTALSEDNRGLWLAAVLGDLTLSRTRLEYVYAKIDRDATVAAFNADDYLWGTGWEGHKGELGAGTGRGSSFHAIAQWQRFKDSADPAAREQWVKRYRLEWRMRF
jgi:hypothetical protein